MDESKKKLLYLYPITPFVDKNRPRDNARPVRFDLVRKYFCSALSISEEEFFDRSKGLINGAIKNYRDKGYEINWAFFSDPNNRDIPLVSQKSHYFDILPNDKKISASITYDEHVKNNKYPDPEKIFDRIKPFDILAVGGFHNSDCVVRIAEAAKLYGVVVRDEAITDQMFGMLYTVFSCDLDAQAIASGRLDPVMHEDDPEEMKRFIVGENLEKYLW